MPVESENIVIQQNGFPDRLESREIGLPFACHPVRTGRFPCVLDPQILGKIGLGEKMFYFPDIIVSPCRKRQYRHLGAGVPAGKKGKEKQKNKKHSYKLSAEKSEKPRKNEEVSGVRPGDCRFKESRFLSYCPLYIFFIF